MALSMDEQRILAEIERKLAADDPALAGSLSAFSRPGLSAGFRTPRSRVLASVIVVAVIAFTSLMVYSFSPIRILAHQSRGGTSRPAQKRSEQTVPASHAASSQAAAGQQSTAASRAGASGAQRKAPSVPARKTGATRAAAPSAQPSALPNATASPG
jgi:type IV secretory pathway VirB6-like protein